MQGDFLLDDVVSLPQRQADRFIGIRVDPPTRTPIPE